MLNDPQLPADAVAAEATPRRWEAIAQAEGFLREGRFRHAGQASP